MKRVLEGVRILAVEQYGAGPYGTQLLAELGAEVVKIEAPSMGGDVSRATGPYFLGDGDSQFFQTFSRSKKSVALELKTPEGRATFEALVFGTKSGLDPKQMCEVLSAGGGINIATTHKVPKCVLPRTFPKLFTTDLMYKDVRLGAEEAEAIGAPLWVINATRNFLAFAISQGDGPVDWANTIKHFEGWAGVTVGSPAAGNRAE